MALNYDVTSYEKKPPPETKHEAPLVVTKDRKIEPEKLDRIKTDKVTIDSDISQKICNKDV